VPLGTGEKSSTMTRSLAVCLTVVLTAAVAAALGASPAAADGAPAMRKADCFAFARLPAIRLVVRNEDTLVAMGARGHVEIDFRREMGLFVSLGPEKVNLAAVTIKGVKTVEGKLVVETEELGFEQLLAADGQFYSYDFAIVPRSELPVEGFVERIGPCPGLCAMSTLIPVSRALTFKDFREKGEARGYEVTVVSDLNPMIKRVGWLHSVAFDASRPGGPKHVTCRVMTVKSGEGSVAVIEVGGAPLGAGGKRAIKECPADKDKICAGLKGTFETRPYAYEQAAGQIVWGYVNSKDSNEIHFPAIWEPEIDEERFRKHIKSDRKHFVSASGEFLGAVDEVGTGGSLRWRKPYIRARKTIAGTGGVTMGYCDELKLFQILIAGTKTADENELRDVARKQARRVGVRLDDEVTKAARFSFHVSSTK